MWNSKWATGVWSSRRHSSRGSAESRCRRDNSAAGGGTAGGEDNGDVTLQGLTESVLRLPALPQTASAIIQVADSPESSARDLKDVVSTDQALVTRLLRVVNSPMYALRQRVTTVTHAIALLGFEAVKNLALAASFSEILKAPAAGYGLEPGRLWLHSIAVGSAATAVASKAKGSNPEEAFVAGVIHDVGKLAISVYVEDAYEGIIRTVAQDLVPFNQAEKEALGFCHAEAGAAVAESWGLPDTLVHPIRWHHQPMEAEEPALACVVHIADAVAISLGHGLGREGLAYTLLPEALEAMDLTEQDLEIIAAGVPAAVLRWTRAAQGER